MNHHPVRLRSYKVSDSHKHDLAVAVKRILELETQVATMQTILSGFHAFSLRDQLPPNPNNEELEDCLVDMQGRFDRDVVEASNDSVVEASNDSHNQLAELSTLKCITI